MVKFLREDGKLKKDIPSCKPSEKSCPCSGLLETLLLLYTSQPSENSEKLLEILVPLFEETHLFNTTFHPKLLARNSYFCPELKITMYQPCGLESCIFYSPAKNWCNNCILDYMGKQHDEDDEKRQTKQKQTSLSYNELTILMGIPTTDLRKNLTSALLKMRQEILKIQITEENLEGRQYRILSSSVCPVCEKTLTEDFITCKGIAYCSSVCSAFKPPHVLKTEQDFGLPIEKILQRCLTNFSSLNTISTSLGLERDQLERLCTTYNLSLPAS